MATTPDYPILGPPRISAAGFATVLRAAGSPSASEAAACYQAFVSQGVDPAVGLAVFRKESTYGRFGRANRNRSWGNIRGSSAGYPVDDGNFRIYPAWTAGAGDCARLLGIYGRNQIRPGVNTSTVQTFPYVWAPSSDGNAPDRYGDQLVSWITAWSRQYPGSGSGAPGVVTPPPAETVGTRENSLALLQRLGISTDPAHVLTMAEAEAIAEQGYGLQRGSTLWRMTADKLAGETVETWVGGKVGQLTNPVDDLGAAISQLGDVLVKGATSAVLLVAILAVILLALYRITKS